MKLSTICFNLILWSLLIMHTDGHLERRSGLVLDPPGERTLDENAKMKKFDQYLDHFDLTNLSTFKQIYFERNDFCGNSSDCPVFLYVGGESAASPTWTHSGAWLNYAMNHRARMFLLEHRFYGLSQPSKEMSVSDLKFLSSSQAISDIAYFIDRMNKKHCFTKKNKWILFGGSYAGSLVAWARMTYPHLIHGAISSSAPLMARLDFKEYIEAFKEGVDNITGNNDCTRIIHEAFSQLMDMINKGDRNSIIKLLNICDDYDIKSVNDNAVLFMILSGPMVNCLQYNKIKCNIIDTCRIWTNTTTKNIIDRLVQMHKANSKNSDKCISVSYNLIVSEYNKTAWNSSVSNGERQWTFQTCSEFGFYQTSSTADSLLNAGLPLSFSTDLCKDVFGEKYKKENLERAIERSNMQHGSLNIQVSRVLFIYGSIDPWHKLGLTKKQNSQAPIIFIQGTSHCADMYSSNVNDPPQLISARLRTDAMIKTWLSQQNDQLETSSPFGNFSPSNVIQQLSNLSPIKPA